MNEKRGSCEELLLHTEKSILPKEYIMLNYRLILNKELYESKIINTQVFQKMEKILITKMNGLIAKNME